MRKTDIVNALARARGGTRYLEIATPTTGGHFGLIESDPLTVRHRLLYHCPETFDDGLPITFRTAVCGSSDLIRAIDTVLPAEDRYDIVFVDPWHAYDTSMADLHGALCLLKPGGIIVVHDCNPHDIETMTPEHRAGDWCGVTYQAFVDFVLGCAPAGYCVVDSDYGCGVVFGPGTAVLAALPTSRPSERLVFEWALSAASDEQRRSCFTRHRAELLNVVSSAQLQEALAAESPVELHWEVASVTA